MITFKDGYTIRFFNVQGFRRDFRLREIMFSVQFQVRVSLYLPFVSNWLMDTLHKLGFRCSYTEFQSFVNCSVNWHGADLSEMI